MDILLTGASGFVGRHLAGALVKEHKVFVVNRQSSGAPNEMVHDFARALPTHLLPSRVDAVIHTAGLVGHQANSSPLCERINVEATIELANYAVRAGARHFVFFSTGGVYQPTEERLTEDSAVAPHDAYTESKLAAEAALQEVRGHLVVQVLRLFFPFGPTQHGRLIPSLIQRVLQEKPIHLTSKEGNPLVTPLYIDDLLEYLHRLLVIPESLVANLAGNDAVSIRALAEIIGDKLKRKVSFEITEGERGCNWWGDNQFISGLTDYSPRVPLELGLVRTIANSSN